MPPSPRLDRIADATERLAAAAERIAVVLERDAAMGDFLNAALGGPVDAGSIDPAALDWRNGHDGGFTVADGNGGRRDATADEAAAIRAGVKPRRTGR